MAIRLATGSATVATISAAGLVAPLAADMSTTHTALLVLAIGAGSLFFSHVNDAGFWLVKEYFGMSVGQTVKTWSVMETHHLRGRARSSSCCSRSWSRAALAGGPGTGWSIPVPGPPLARAGVQPVAARFSARTRRATLRTVRLRGRKANCRGTAPGRASEVRRRRLK